MRVAGEKCTATYRKEDFKRSDESRASRLTRCVKVNLPTQGDVENRVTDHRSKNA